MRELLGYGTLLSGADLLLGDWAKALEIQIFTTDANFLLAILPPGAFLGMGLLIAAKNIIDDVIEKRAAQNSTKVVQRARVTGTEI
jgi:electron transport complex protein RnfE